jgi:hypothetical protein
LFLSAVRLDEKELPMRLTILMVCGVLPLSAPQDIPTPPALKVPAEVKAPAATISEVRAETTGKVVVWVVLTPGLSVRPIDGGRVLLFSGPAGRYECLAYTAIGDVPSEPARCAIIIGEAPGPSPKPKPDPPPDPLRAKLKAAFDADGAPVELKRDQARDLAALYRAAAKLAEDPAVTTAGELLKRVRDAAGTLVGPDALREVRRVAGNELASLLPTDSALKNDGRAAAAGLFRKLAVILEELSP